MSPHPITDRMWKDYSYADNSPVNATDPYGLFTWSVGITTTMQIVIYAGVGFIASPIEVNTCFSGLNYSRVLSSTYGHFVASGADISASVGLELQITNAPDVCKLMGQAFIYSISGGMPLRTSLFSPSITVGVWASANMEYWGVVMVANLITVGAPVSLPTGALAQTLTYWWTRPEGVRCAPCGD